MAVHSSRAQALTSLGSSPMRFLPRATVGRVGRKPISDDATSNLKASDETQVAPKGTKIGKLSREKVLGDFQKVIAGKKAAS